MTYKGRIEMRILNIMFSMGLVTLSACFPAWAQSTLLIENVTLIDGTGAAGIDKVSVLVENGRISNVSVQRLAAPRAARVIDGSGKFLIPGIIDSHMHLPGGRQGPGNSEMIMDTATGLRVLHGFLYAGVTAVYDSGNHANFIYKMRDDERAGRIISPRIYATGSLVAKKDGYACCAGSTTIDGFEDGRGKLDALFTQKPDMLKFTRDRRGMGPQAKELPVIPDDDFSKLIRYAKEKGVRTTIHIADETAARLAISAGVDALAHPVFLADASTGFAQYAAEQNVVISSTALLFGAVGRVELDNSFFDGPLFAAILTDEELEFNKVTERNRYASSGMSGWMRGVLPAVLRNLKQLHDAGAIIAMGTDRVLGPMVHMEMQLLADAGIPLVDVIKASTLNAAQYIGVEDDLGSIEIGKIADMVLLSDDPTKDIRNSRTIEAVFKNGQEIDRNALNLPINGK